MPRIPYFLFPCLLSSGLVAGVVAVEIETEIVTANFEVSGAAVELVRASLLFGKPWPGCVMRCKKTENVYFLSRSDIFSSLDKI